MTTIVRACVKLTNTSRSAWAPLVVLATLGIFLTSFLICPCIARSANWYSKITLHRDYETPSGSMYGSTTGASFSVPSINASGQVVFTEKVISGKNSSYASTLHDTIYRADASDKKNILISDPVSSSEDYFHWHAWNPPHLNDQGDVCFAATNNTGNFVAKFNAATETYTTITQSTISTWDNFTRPTISNEGVVAFNAHLNGEWGVWIGDGGAIEKRMDLPSGNQWAPTSVLKGTSMPAVYTYADWEAIQYEKIWTHDGQSERWVAKYPAGLTPYEGISGDINHVSAHGGQAPVFAYVADPVGGVDQAIYVSTAASNGGASPIPMVVADTGGSINAFDAISISAHGVAFTATEDVSDLKSLYLAYETSPGSWNQKKLLSVGDAIEQYESNIEDIEMTRYAMNDLGQIVVDVSFENREDAIIRLDPFVMTTVPETDLSLGVMKTEDYAAISQMVEFVPGDDSLGFDFSFPNGTGNLVISLDDNVIAEISSAEGAADRLSRFETQVDLVTLFPDVTDQALLKFVLQSNEGATGLYLDNIDFGALTNGDFAAGNLDTWQSSVSSGLVGVGVNPYAVTSVVPEPSAVVIAGLGLPAALFWRKRRKACCIH